MKTLFICLTYILISATAVFSQSSWFWKNPMPSGNDWYDFQFTDSYTGYTISDNFSILKTTDTGEKWDLIHTKSDLPSGVSGAFRAVFFINSLTGFAGSNAIFKSTDGGLNWTYITSLGVIVRSLYFTDQFTGYAACDKGKIFSTTDGGINWSLQYSAADTTADLNKILFVSADTGFAVGKRQTVFRTTDRGNTWNVRYLSWGFPLYDISFIDHNTGFLTGEYGVIIKTTNSGISWTYLNRFTPNNLKSICFISQDTGFSVSTLSGSEGKIFRTINGGDKWSLLADLNIFIYKINFIDKLTGFVTCEGGNIFKTTNAGETWISKISGCMNANLVSIDFISADTGFAVGSKSLLLKTTNGGDEWRKMNCPINSNYIYVKFFDNENGYLAGTILYKTTNSGISWDNIANLNGLDDIIFYNIDTGYYMKNDILFKTFNGGNNWTSSKVEFASQKFYFLENKDTGFYFTSYYTIYPSYLNFNDIYKTENNGADWTLLTRFTHAYGSGYINSIYFTDSQTGFLSGTPGIKKTTDGGASWNTYPGLNGFSGKLYFNDSENGFVTKNNEVYGTDNGGNNWSKLFTASKHLNAFYFLNSNTGFVAGNFGNILKTTNGGGNFVNIFNESNFVANGYSLFQNYPNPFNPLTTIGYYLPNDGMVSMKIFDILGKEIYSFSGLKKTGYHEIRFNGTDLSSGIYFYRIESGKFSQTKRMVLLK